MISVRRFALWAGLGACLTGSMLDSSARTAQAQSTLPVCPPPSAQEFLVLVRGSSESERSRAAAVLPVESTVLICQYLNEVVVRGGGFVSLETANAWASYMNTVEGFESFVLRPASPSADPPDNPSGNSPVGNRGGDGYQPQRLQAGYAVLVDYGNRPEIATSVSQLVRPVGLAVYQQKPYLLAEFASDPITAAATLQRLSDANLSAVLVDAQQVVRLTTNVR